MVVVDFEIGFTFIFISFLIISINFFKEKKMQNGYIKMFDQYKGFGFIVTDDGDEIYFSKDDVHPKYKNILIREETRVGFDLKRGMKGDKAVNVRLL